jgi:hypothetical protein
MKHGDRIYCLATVTRFTLRARAPKTVRSTSGATCQTFPRRTIGPAQRRWPFRAKAISCSSKWYGPTYPRTPACHSFTIVAKIKPGTEGEIRAYGKRIEDTIAASPQALASLHLHYLRWVFFNIGQEKYFMYHGIFDTEFDK